MALSIIWFLYLVCSVASAFGISVALVKKQDDWPVSFYANILRKYILPIFHRNMPDMLDCVVCTSFWVTLLTDLFIHLVFAPAYFAWPISGFITLGLSWVLMDALDSLSAIGTAIQSKRENEDEE